MITRQQLVGAASLVAFTLVFATWIATSPEPPRPAWSRNSWGPLFIPVLIAAQLAWGERQRGPIRMAVRALAGFGGIIVWALIVDALVGWLHPWAREQTWIAPAIAMVLALAATSIAIRYVMMQPTRRLTRVAIAQTVALAATFVDFGSAPAGGSRHPGSGS